jgi:predicted DNA-binding transcriptional regulator YafY
MGSKNIYERFVWFDHKVRSGKYPNATSLSVQFEISVKTAQRDIEFMRDRLKCPLSYDKSQKGYYYEDNTFFLPMVYLSSEELSSLLIARKFLKDISGGYVGKEISSIINKITTILKKHVAEETLIDDALSFQLIEYSPAPEEIFKVILEGCLKRRSLRFTYRSLTKHDKTTRTVDPYHLLNYMGTWHLIAYCHLRNGLRNFVFGRISDLKILENTFTIPKSFNIHEHLQSAFGIYKGITTKEVCLRFTPEKARWITGQVWHKDQKVKINNDGSLELSFPVADFAEIKMEILKHGSVVEVIRPKALRELVREEARRIMRIYK